MDYSFTINSYLQKEYVLWIDTETGGVYTQCDIFQLACLIEHNGTIIASFNEYCKPFFDSIVTPQALHITHINSKTLHSFQDPFVLYSKFLTFLQTYLIDTSQMSNKPPPQLSQIIGHAIQFDCRKLKQFEYKILHNYMYAIIENNMSDTLESYINIDQSYCTLQLSRKLKKIGLHTASSNKLIDLASNCHINYSQLHRADEDIRVTRDVTYELISRKLDYEKKKLSSNSV